MKKYRSKHQQLSLMNPKRAGRKPIHDKGIRHTERTKVKKNTALHLTVKIEKNKAGLKSKSLMKILHGSIKKARLIGLRIIHYTLEYDHVHLLVEADNNEILGKGMQSFGISFSKGINRIKKLKGRVFKTRYHFRELKTPNEIKNVINYIMGNGLKHKEATSILSPYNSLAGMHSFSKMYPAFERAIEEAIKRSLTLSSLRADLKATLSAPRNFLIQNLLS